MTLPFFYISTYDQSQKEIVLDDNTSKHVVQVLRTRVGEKLKLTDGKGNMLTCTVIDDHKKHCVVKVEEINYKEQSPQKISIAISLLKNVNRFEWFLEKVTEIGVNEIIPLVCERTEKEKFRFERMKEILISAMLQSQQCWLPVLTEPTTFNLAISSSIFQQKFIAHCSEGNKQSLNKYAIEKLTNSQIYIGPEGDFTPKEIELALKHHCIPVSLGETRLRSETAGIVAAALLSHI